MWDSKSNAFFDLAKKTFQFESFFFNCAQTQVVSAFIKNLNSTTLLSGKPLSKKVPSNSIAKERFAKACMVGAQRSCVSSRSLCFKVPFGWGSWNATKKPWGWGKQTLRKGEIITVYQSPRQHESFGYEILTFRYCELFGFVDKSRETVFFMNIIFCLTTNCSIHWRSLRFRRAIYSTPLTTRSHAPNSVSRQLGVLASRRRYVLLGMCPVPLTFVQLLAGMELPRFCMTHDGSAAIS